MITEETRKKIDELTEGCSIIANCGFGFGVRVSLKSDGLKNERAWIEVDPSPAGLDHPEYGALREFIEETAINWLRQVAPHRLAMGANER